MNKKIVILFLTLGMLAFAGCGDAKEEDTKDTEQTTDEQASEEETDAEEEFVLTNAEGKVTAVDVENLENYVTLGTYQNLTIEQEAKEEISDERVDLTAYQQMQEQYSYGPNEVTEDRPVQKFDTVNIDFTGYMDGEEFSGGSSEDYDLLIGAGQFIDGFEEGLIGHKKGEEVTLDLTFPEDYQQTDFQGKAVQFVVTINEISEPAELTDAWTAENTDFQTVEEYKADLKSQLQTMVDHDYESQIKSDLFSMLVESTEIKEYPEEPLEAAKADMERQIEETYAAASGMTLEEFWEARGTSEEEAEQMVTSMAEQSLTQNLIVQAILEAEGKELTEEEYLEEEEKFAELSGFEDAATMNSMYTDKKVIKDSVLWNTACDIMMSTAVIQEVQAAE